MEQGRTRRAIRVSAFRSAVNGASFSSVQEAGDSEANWDLDLFGGIRRAVEAQTYDAEALKAAWDWVMVVVTADVARDYLDMCAERAPRRPQEEHRRRPRRSRARADPLRPRAHQRIGRRAGRRQLATFQAPLAPLEAQLDTRRQAIAVLMGQDPEDLATDLAKPGPIPTLPRRIPTGGPVDLPLRRRPDIAEAERRVAGATAHRRCDSQCSQTCS